MTPGNRKMMQHKPPPMRWKETVKDQRSWHIPSERETFQATWRQRLCTSLPLAARSLAYCALTRNSEDVTLWIATDACMFNIQQAVVTRFKWAGCSAYGEFSQFVGLVGEQAALQIGGDELQNVDGDVLGGFSQKDLKVPCMDGESFVHHEQKGLCLLSTAPGPWIWYLYRYLLWQSVSSID